MTAPAITIQSPVLLATVVLLVPSALQCQVCLFENDQWEGKDSLFQAFLPLQKVPCSKQREGGYHLGADTW